MWFSWLTSTIACSADGRRRSRWRAAYMPMYPPPTIRILLTPLWCGEPVDHGDDPAEVIDRRVRLRELRGGGIVGRLSPEDPDRAHPRGLRRPDVVVEAVPHHHRLRRVHAGRPDGVDEQRGIRLLHP